MSRTEYKTLLVRLDFHTLSELDKMRIRNGDISRAEQIRRLIIQHIDDYQIIVSLSPAEWQMLEEIRIRSGNKQIDNSTLIRLCLQGFFTIMNTQLKDLLRPLKILKKEKEKKKAETED